MIRLTREEIYQLVWEQPMTEIAKKYLISDVGFRKICLKLNIPIPVVAHWAKVRSGRKQPQPKLPVNWKVPAFVDLKERPDGDPVKKVSKRDKLAKELSNVKLPFKVPDRLVNPDPLTVAAKESLAKTTNLNHPGMVVTGKCALDIRVSPSNVGRALRFMDTLVKCIRARGHHYETDEDKNYVLIRNIRLRVNFREKTSKVNVTNKPYKDYEWKPNGRVVFRVDGRQRAEWQDTKTQLLEEQLPKILAKLEVAAKQKEEDEERARIWREKMEHERKVQAEREMRQRDELKKFKDLIIAAKQWKQAQLLREYLSAIPHPDNDWLSWANLKADWLDPNIDFEDEWLSNIDKNSF